MSALIHWQVAAGRQLELRRLLLCQVGGRHVLSYPDSTDFGRARLLGLLTARPRLAPLCQDARGETSRNGKVRQGADMIEPEDVLTAS